MPGHEARDPVGVAADAGDRLLGIVAVAPEDPGGLRAIQPGCAPRRAAACSRTRAGREWTCADATPSATHACGRVGRLGAVVNRDSVVWGFSSDMRSTRNVRQAARVPCRRPPGTSDRLGEDEPKRLDVALDSSPSPARYEKRRRSGLRQATATGTSTSRSTGGTWWGPRATVTERSVPIRSRRRTGRTWWSWSAPTARAQSSSPGRVAARGGAQRDRYGDGLVVVEQERRQVAGRAQAVAAVGAGRSFDGIAQAS